MISLFNAAGAIALFAAIQAIWLGSLSRNIQIFRAYAFICVFNAIFLLSSAAWYSADTLNQAFIAAKGQTLGGLGHVMAFAWLIATMAGLVKQRGVLIALWTASAIMAAIILAAVSASPETLLPNLELIGKKTFLLQTITVFENTQTTVGAGIDLFTLGIYMCCLAGMVPIFRYGDRITAAWLLSYIVIQAGCLVFRATYNLGLGDTRFPTGIAVIWLLLTISICYAREHQLTVKRLKTQDHLLRKEITSRTQTEEKLRKRAYFDELTKVPNELWLRDHLGREFVKASPLRVLMLVQLHDFRGIRLRFGDANADRLLIKVVQRLRENLSTEDVVARVNDSTFCIIVRSLNKEYFDRINRETSSGQLNEKLIKPYYLDRQRVDINFNLGIVDASKEDTPENLLYRTEQALNEAVRLGRNQGVFYSDALSAQLTREKQLEADLSTSLENGEFELFYQPKVNHAGICLGAEALIRWNHHSEGMISPVQFISLAERCGFMIDLGNWVIRDACRFLRTANDQGLRLPNRLSINISPLQLLDDSVATALTSSLRDYGLEASQLELELTESALVDTTAENRALLESLRDMGVTIAIDDFGTGYSSLAYLQHLPLDVLKIDKRFVDNLDEPQGEQLVYAIIQMGRALKMNTVAEGVETQRQMEALKGMGCDQFQGYFFSKPLPEDKFLRWLATGKRVAAV